MKPCEHCNMPEYCKDLGRCYFKGLDTRQEEGEMTEIEEVYEPMLKKEKPVKVPEKLSKAHREFLKDSLNF